MTLLRTSVLAVAMAACLPALAETVPSASPLDPRIQVVRHTGDIVRVTAAEGIQTTIEVPRGETIKDFAMGDREAWKAKHSGNLFIFKPQAPKGNTNLTIFTDRGAYLFRLVMLRKEAPQVAYWLKVEVPPPPPPASTAASGGKPMPTPEERAAAKREADRRQMSEDFRAVKYEGTLNHDYWIVGPTELQPIAAHDNGTFTYLTFSAANPLPAPFVLEPDNTESLIDFHMDADGMTMVLHRVVGRIVLRRGQLVAGVENRALRHNAQPSLTGTTSDRVQRSIPMQGDN